MSPPRSDPAAGAAGDAPLQVVAVLDVVCPWSCIVLPSLRRLAADHGARIALRPHWLHPEVPPEGMAVEDAARHESTAAWIREVAPDQAATMRFRAWIPSSFRAFEALDLAAERGRGLELAEAVFDAHWRREEDIGSVQTLRRAAESAGLDGDEVADALCAHSRALGVVRTLEAARRAGVTATPTLFIGRTRLDGWHYHEVLESIVERQDGRRVAGARG